jgi:hypothetical protein
LADLYATSTRLISHAKRTFDTFSGRLADHLADRLADQESLALWSAMFAMVYATSYPDSETIITSQQRKELKEKQKAPQYWIFWYAPFDGASSLPFKWGLAQVSASQWLVKMLHTQIGLR